MSCGSRMRTAAPAHRRLERPCAVPFPCRARVSEPAHQPFPSVSAAGDPPRWTTGSGCSAGVVARCGSAEEVEVFLGRFFGSATRDVARRACVLQFKCAWPGAGVRAHGAVVASAFRVLDVALSVGRPAERVDGCPVLAVALEVELHGLCCSHEAVGRVSGRKSRLKAFASCRHA